MIQVNLQITNNIQVLKAFGFYASHQCQHIRLFQMSTEDAPVSMSGRLVADDRTSEELLRRRALARTVTLKFNAETRMCTDLLYEFREVNSNFELLHNDRLTISYLHDVRLATFYLPRRPRTLADTHADLIKTAPLTQLMLCIFNLQSTEQKH